MPRKMSSMTPSAEWFGVTACIGKDHDVSAPVTSRRAKVSRRSSATMSKTGSEDCELMRSASTSSTCASAACMHCQVTSRVVLPRQRLTLRATRRQFVLLCLGRVLPGRPLCVQWNQPSLSSFTGETSTWPSSGTRTSPPRPSCTTSSQCCDPDSRRSVSVQSVVLATLGLRQQYTSHGQAFVMVKGACTSTVARPSSRLLRVCSQWRGSTSRMAGGGDEHTVTPPSSWTPAGAAGEKGSDHS
mmetsp:Transcript_3088/g.8227  ORF Transcript_3088/g.8227 Transcript_3088/m.8227 type:complete len:243 (+) Transcript_3088:875-1603(+)